MPAIAAAPDDGTLVELLYDASAKRTALAIWQDHEWRIVDRFVTGTGERLVPYSAQNNLIRNGVILFPLEPEEYGTEQDLIEAIQAFIHRYVDLSARFERIASYYVLLSWLHDTFNELPYLRLRGDYGSGKTRFLLIVGSLCYRPIFASGASTVSPIFHILDRFGGTLIVDEADFRFSDEKADIVKILNNGNVRGVPVLRTHVTRDREYNPQAFRVFGPKIVATRGYFDDKALESRFITEETSGRRLRADVPINMPPDYPDEALSLRNKLLLYRFRNRGKRAPSEALVDRSIEPRLNQVFVPLLSIAEDPAVRMELREIARAYHRDQVAERGMQVEAQLLTVIRSLFATSEKAGVAIKDIVSLFACTWGKDYEHQLSHKWVGSIIRRRLSVRTRKSHGNYVIPLTEHDKLEHLYERYGITGADVAALERLQGPDEVDLRRLVDMRDVGDVPRTQPEESG